MFGLPTLLVAALTGLGAAALAAVTTSRGIAAVDRTPGRWPIRAAIGAGLLSLLLCMALDALAVQFTDEVRPVPFWYDFRAISHSILIALLVAATCTDLDDYYIPDLITVPGMLAGIVLATASGDLQVAHVWVDWNEAVPQIRGPYLPPWLSAHPHLHGFVWSVAGLLTGAALAWAVRGIAGRLLGQEALGFGDVMLMGMVGSFLGWQPTVVAFLLAPLCALSVGLGIRMLGGKSYIPYGPYLALASLIVMFSWRWIWMFEFRLYEAAVANDREGIFAVRRFFGDWLSLLALAGMILFGLVLLLGLGRLYRMIPGKSDASADPPTLGEPETPGEPATPGEPPT